MVTGINSAAALSANSVVSFTLFFGKNATAAHEVSAVVIPEWDGEILLGWRTLKELGINFSHENKRKPARVRFTRLGTDCELMELLPEETIHHLGVSEAQNNVRTIKNNFWPPGLSF